MSSFNFFHTSKFDLFIKESQIPCGGNGVYSRNFIPEDTFIDYYSGEIVDHLSTGEYYFYVSPEFGIDASSFPRCMMAMMNDAGYRPKSKKKLKGWKDHSFQNNCEFIIREDKVEVWSIKDIPSFTELFASYGDEFWN
jgi:hypothetical protein